MRYNLLVVTTMSTPAGVGVHSIELSFMTVAEADAIATKLRACNMRDAWALEYKVTELY